MKKTILFLILQIFILIHCFSQSKQDNIQSLISIMHIDSLARASLRQALVHQINRQGFAKQDTLKVKNFVKSNRPVEDSIADRLINNDIVRYIDKNFNGNEIDILISFYNQPIGQKSLKIFHNFDLIIWDSLENNYIPEITKKIEKFAKEIKNKNSP